ncbi:MAG: sigma-70 family RNA polymerase sigma factor [Planctomycetota bacterium]
MMLATETPAPPKPFVPRPVRARPQASEVAVSGIRCVDELGATSEREFDGFFEPTFESETAARKIMAAMPASRNSRKQSPPKGLPSYWASLWSIPLLNADQETHCFRQLNYLKYRLSAPDLKRTERRRLERKQQRVRHQLAESNLRLVISLAKRYAAPGSDEWDDLVGNGNTALVKAVDLFDYRRGFRFSTYAYQAIQRSMFSVLRREQRLRVVFKTDADDVTETISQDAAASDWAERVAQEARHRVRQWIDALDERDQHIVKSRFGIDRDTNGSSFRVIAKEVGLSTTRTVQLFNRSMERLRREAIDETIAIA